MKMEYLLIKTVSPYGPQMLKLNKYIVIKQHNNVNIFRVITTT